MRRRALLATAAGSVAAGCGARDGSSDDSGTIAEPLRGTPTAADGIVWRRQTPGVELLGVIDGRVLAVTRDDGFRLAAFAPATGERLWATRFDGRPFPRLVGETLATNVRGDPESVVGVDVSTGERLWSVTGRTTFQQPTSEVVVVQRGEIGDATVRGYDAETGGSRWRAPVARSFGGRGDVLVGLRPTGDRLIARDIVTGDRLWNTRVPSWIVRSGMEQLDGARVFAGSEGRLLGIDRDGGVVFRDEFDPSFTTSGSTGVGRIVYGDGRIPTEAAPPGRVAAVDPTDGVAWTRTIESRAVAPIVRGGAVYGVLDPATVARFDSTTGDRRWERDGFLVATDDGAPFVANDGRLRALDSDGRVRWETQFDSEATSPDPYPLADPEGTVVRTTEGRLVVASRRNVTVYDADDGTVLARVAVDGAPERIALGSDAVFVGTDSTILAVSY